MKWNRTVLSETSSKCGRFVIHNCTAPAFPGSRYYAMQMNGEYVTSLCAGSLITRTFPTLKEAKEYADYLMDKEKMKKCNECKEGRHFIHKNGKEYIVHSEDGCFYLDGKPIYGKFGGQCLRNGKPFGPMRDMNIENVKEWL